MSDEQNGEIVEDKRGRRKVVFPDGSKYDCCGYVGDTRVAYMCATDFDDEVGEHAVTKDGKPEGTKLYDSVEELPECVRECGYVKVLLVAIDRHRPQRCGASVTWTTPVEKPVGA